MRRSHEESATSQARIPRFAPNDNGFSAKLLGHLSLGLVAAMALAQLQLAPVSAQTSPTFDALRVNAPTSITVNAGEVATYFVTAVGNPGMYRKSIRLSSPGIPDKGIEPVTFSGGAWVYLVFSVMSIGDTLDFSFRSSPTTPGGTYTLVIQAKDDATGTTRTAQVTLVVRARATTTPAPTASGSATSTSWSGTWTVATAQNCAPSSGTWTGTFSVDGTRLSGSQTGIYAWQGAIEGQVTGSQLSFTSPNRKSVPGGFAPVNPADFAVTATISGSSLSGTFTDKCYELSTSGQVLAVQDVRGTIVGTTVGTVSPPAASPTPTLTPTPTAAPTAVSPPAASPTPTLTPTPTAAPTAVPTGGVPLPAPTPTAAPTAVPTGGVPLPAPVAEPVTDLPIPAVPEPLAELGQEPSMFSLSLVLGGEEEIVEGSGPGLGWVVEVTWTGAPQAVQMDAQARVTEIDPPDPALAALREDTLRREWVAGRDSTPGRAREERLSLHLEADRLPASIGQQYPVAWVDTEVVATSHDGTQQQTLMLPTTTVFSCNANWWATLPALRLRGALPATRLLDAGVTHQLTAAGEPIPLQRPFAPPDVEFRQFDEEAREPLIVFRPSIAAIISWVRLGPVFPTAPNVLTWEWVDPDGSIAQTELISLAPTPERCTFWPEQSAMAQLPAPQTGLWRVNVSIEGDLLTTQFFRVE